MDQIIFRYPGQVFVGIATRRPDGTLDHQGFVLLNAVPKKGTPLFDRPIAELLNDEVLLKEITRLAKVEKIEAVAVLGRKE